jgi:hypothetical protein
LYAGPLFIERSEPKTLLTILEEANDIPAVFTLACLEVNGAALAT